MLRINLHRVPLVEAPLCPPELMARQGLEEASEAAPPVVALQGIPEGGPRVTPVGGLGDPRALRMAAPVLL